MRRRLALGPIRSSRLDSARLNYLRLYALSPKLAGKLLRSMQKWLAEHGDSPPSGVDVQAFSEWVAERAKSQQMETSDDRW